MRFVFFLRLAGFPRGRCRKDQKEGWLELPTQQLGGDVTISGAFEATWTRTTRRRMDFFTLVGRRIDQDLLLKEMPLPWFAEGISSVPRKRLREVAGAPTKGQEILSSPDEGAGRSQKRRCKNKEKRKKKRNGKGYTSKRSVSERGPPCAGLFAYPFICGPRCLSKQKVSVLS